jgi:hypothetical protein
MAKNLQSDDVRIIMANLLDNVLLSIFPVESPLWAVGV